MSQEAIDGTEQFADADPRSALAAFYRAFNERDLEATERVWLGGEEPSMSNPLGYRPRRGGDRGRVPPPVW